MRMNNYLIRFRPVIWTIYPELVPLVCSKEFGAVCWIKVHRIDWFFMRQISDITAFIFNISEVPQLDCSINRGCSHQPITPRVEFCMGHFGFVQLLFENLMSIQAKQKKSSSIISSHKHLTTNRHVQTAVPVTGRVTFVALKLYTNTSSHNIQFILDIMAVKYTQIHTHHQTKLKWQWSHLTKKQRLSERQMWQAISDKSTVDLYCMLKGNCFCRTAI